MASPFLYFAGDRLSTAELTAACRDGHLIEIGEAFMPADAVETRELRAASLASIVRRGLAATHDTAAWVHGARTDPPARHHVQRISERRLHHVIDGRMRYRDVRLDPLDAVFISHIPVTTPARTLVDLVRDGLVRERSAGDGAVRDDDTLAMVDALIATHCGVVADALSWFERVGAIHRKRPSQAYLLSRL